MIRILWRLSRGYRLCPWRSPYLRWRIETYSGLHADEIIFLERGLPVQAQIDFLVDELARCPLDEVYLSPAARALVERVAAEREDRRDDGREAHGG